MIEGIGNKRPLFQSVVIFGGGMVTSGSLSKEENLILEAEILTGNELV